MITGCSTHNQRIERLWRDMHKSATVMYYNTTKINTFCVKVLAYMKVDI